MWTRTPILATMLVALALFAAPTAAQAQAATVDPAILVAVDAAIAAINSGSVADAKAAFADPPAAITDDFPPFVWSGKNAVEEYTHDLNEILTKLKITEWRFQRHQPRYFGATEDHAWLAVPVSFPFLMNGKTQSVAGDWVFVLIKQGGKWRVDVLAFAESHHTLLP